MIRKKAAFLNDAHFPLHSPAAIQACCQLLSDHRPEYIFFVGDMLDGGAISRHGVRHDHPTRWQEELDIFYDQMDRLICAAGSQCHTKMFMLGNHEDWWRQWLDKNKQVANLRCLSYDRLLKYKELGITHSMPYGETCRFQGLTLTHGSIARKQPGATAAQMLIEHFSSGLSGHVHRATQVKVTKSSGTYTWTENGCLCKLNPKYAKNGIPNWSHAMSIGYQTGSRYQVDLQLLHTEDYTHLSRTIT